jgi:hypothetical protein
MNFFLNEFLYYNSFFYFLYFSVMTYFIAGKIMFKFAGRLIKCPFQDVLNIKNRFFMFNTRIIYCCCF